MSETENNLIVHSVTLSPSRRAISVDEYSLDAMHRSSNEKIMNGKHQPMIKQSTVTCAPLSRRNSRPSAKTCWFVLSSFFLSSKKIFHWWFSRRHRAIFAPLPNCDFGPKCTLKQVQNKSQLLYIYFVLYNKPPPAIKDPGPSIFFSNRRILIGAFYSGRGFM